MDKIVLVDPKDIKEMNKFLSVIGRNSKQITKQVNARAPACQAVMKKSGKDWARYGSYKGASY